jgi:hypothetical protein
MPWTHVIKIDTKMRFLGSHNYEYDDVTADVSEERAVLHLGGLPKTTDYRFTQHHIP